VSLITKTKLGLSLLLVSTQRTLLLSRKQEWRSNPKKAIARAMEEYKQLCLKSFSVNRSGKVIQKQELPMRRQITFEANPGKLQDMVDNAINRALINQSSVLSNTVFNAMARTFKEGQAPPLYVGPTYHQPGLSSVTAPSAPLTVVGTEVTSPPSTLGMTNGQSTPMRSNPTTSEGRVQLNTDMSASTMLGSVFQNCQVLTLTNTTWILGCHPQHGARVYERIYEYGGSLENNLFYPQAHR